MKIVVFDFEVFKYDCLMGCYIVNTKEYFQTWDKNKIIDFYNNNKDAIWIGHNNQFYDNFILEAIILNRDPYRISKSIIENHSSHKLSIYLNYYDLITNHFSSLKSLEAFDGKNISESEVDFDISRNLTEEEKRLTESYNRDDLNQTFEDLKRLKDEFQLRLDIIREFNLPLDALHYTEAQIASKALGAKRIENIENIPAEPIMYPNLKIKNKNVIDFYLGKSWSWKNGALKKSINETFCGTEHKIAAGGVHAGDLCHEDFAYYLDVRGYYNLIMINFNLLPRSIPEKGRKLYEFMYHEQLRLKKINPVKRKVYKVILLAVFGAQNNEYSDFYDPNQGDLVRLTGEMFLVDLLEKLEGKVKVIQSNTDGIMIKPLNGTAENQIKEIVDEWQERTKFVLKFEKIYNIIQRDVNNYMYKDENGNVHVKGEALKHYEGEKSPFDADSYRSKEPIIISKCIVEYFINNKKPENVIKENENNLKLFQYICKPVSFDYLELETNKFQEKKITKLQKVNRAFAYNKLDEYNVIYKCSKTKRLKVSNLPNNVFVYNDEILSLNAVKSIKNNIDYNYYINRAYERIKEFELPEQLNLF